MTGARKTTVSSTPPPTPPSSDVDARVPVPRVPKRVSSAAPVNETIRMASEEDMAGMAFSPLTDEDLDGFVADLPIRAHPELLRRELIDLVIVRSGIRRREAKPAVETALAVLGEALSEGRQLNLTPYGTFKVTSIKQNESGLVVDTRLHQSDSDKNSDPDPLAHAAE